MRYDNEIGYDKCKFVRFVLNIPTYSWESGASMESGINSTYMCVPVDTGVVAAFHLSADTESATHKT